MRFFRTEVWSYAILLVILFAIATIAVRTTLGFIAEQVPNTDSYPVVVALMWSLTLGFMLIAGSYGLWAIKFAGESEARRRVGRMVDAMDYLSDGLLVVDNKGRITGSNPAARKFVGRDLIEQEDFSSALANLSAPDIALLTDREQLAEIEREMMVAGVQRSIRFRSQPSEDLVLILMSDITSMNVQRVRSRQSARLQLVGEIARGVAHDFNNLLCGIAGYASILTRLPPGSPEMGRSVQAMSQSVERGIALAGHLLQLSQPAAMTRFTDMAADHIDVAVGLMRESLPSGWQVDLKMEGKLPAVSLSGTQIEQVVTNLGLLVADHSERPSILTVHVGVPESTGVLHVVGSFAGVIVVSCSDQSVAVEGRHAELRKYAGESGVIQSVLRSMLEETGGRLDCLETLEGAPIYRVCLPFGHVIAGVNDAGALSAELKAYIANWNVLLAKTGRETILLERRLSDVGVKVRSFDSITSILAAIEESPGLDAMILDARLLGPEAGALLKAILKIRPTSGVVVMCEDPGSMSRDLASDVVYESIRSGADKVLLSMIESKSLAAKRRNK